MIVGAAYPKFVCFSFCSASSNIFHNDDDVLCCSDDRFDVVSTEFDGVVSSSSSVAIKSTCALFTWEKYACVADGATDKKRSRAGDFLMIIALVVYDRVVCHHRRC